MVQFMEGRLNKMIFLIIILFMLYGCEAVVSMSNAGINEDVVNSVTDINETYDFQNGTYDQSNVKSDVQNIDVWGAVGFIFSFASFGEFGIPFPYNLPLIIFVVVIYTTLAIIVGSFIYDFVKALPFT